MDGKSTRNTGIFLIIVGSIIFVASGLSETYFGNRHVFYESPLYPLSVVFIITGFLMIFGGTFFNYLKRKRVENYATKSSFQVGGVIQGLWKQGKEVKLGNLCKTLGLSRESLKLKICEAMGKGIIDGVFKKETFLPRKISSADIIPVSGLNGY